jgi:hypothetical protein
VARKAAVCNQHAASLSTTSQISAGLMITAGPGGPDYTDLDGTRGGQGLAEHVQ